MAKLQELVCPDCGKKFHQNSYNHTRCVVCAAAFNIQKNVEKARAKRLAQKAAQENQQNGHA